jgi:hypothetical protein
MQGRNPLCIVDKKSAWIISDADNLLMKIKLSYPIKEVVKLNGGFRDFDLASDGSIIAVYGKPHKNGIYRLLSTTPTKISREFAT